MSLLKPPSEPRSSILTRVNSEVRLTVPWSFFAPEFAFENAGSTVHEAGLFLPLPTSTGGKISWLKMNAQPPPLPQPKINVGCMIYLFMFL